MSVYVETERLRLRHFTRSDAELLVKLDSDPAVMHFITGGLSTPREEIEADVLPVFLDYHRRWEHLGFWAVEERASNDFIGWFHLRPRLGHPPQEPELGYRLRQASWGRGYAVEGSRALIDTSFERGDVLQVLAETMAVHAASRRVMEKCGMKLVRHFRADWPYRIPGDDEGDVEYAITRQNGRRRPSRKNKQPIPGVPEPTLVCRRVRKPPGLSKLGQRNPFGP